MVCKLGFARYARLYRAGRAARAYQGIPSLVVLRDLVLGIGSDLKYPHALAVAKSELRYAEDLSGLDGSVSQRLLVVKILYGRFALVRESKVEREYPVLSLLSLRRRVQHRLRYHDIGVRPVPVRNLGSVLVILVIIARGIFIVARDISLDCFLADGIDYLLAVVLVLLQVVEASRPYGVVIPGAEILHCSGVDPLTRHGLLARLLIDGRRLSPAVEVYDYRGRTVFTVVLSVRNIPNLGKRDARELVIVPVRNFEALHRIGRRRELDARLVAIDIRFYYGI